MTTILEQLIGAVNEERRRDPREIVQIRVHRCVPQGLMISMPILPDDEIPDDFGELERELLVHPWDWDRVLEHVRSLPELGTLGRWGNVEAVIGIPVVIDS
jgi:hypothetical protein